MSSSSAPQDRERWPATARSRHLSYLFIFVVSASVLGRAQYPARPAVDPAILERGKALYSVHCAFCHGSDARGGDGGGPNLLRSQLVLSDKNGELIGNIVRDGRPANSMAPIALTSQQIADIADFIHSYNN